MTTDPKWRKFEALAAEIQRELSPEAQIKHNDKIKGEDSKINRQIDISIKQNVGQYNLLIVMQCKDEKTPLDVNVIGEFAAVVSDVRANKGALVSSSGFTNAALNLAKQKGIDLFRLIDVQNKNWKSYASLPAAAIFDEFGGYQLKFANNPKFPPERFRIPLELLKDIPNIPLYKEDGTFIDTIFNAIRIAWNNKEIPHTSGEHVDLRFVKDSVFIKDETNLVPIELTANVIVRQKIFIGDVPIISMRGFQNLSTGGVHTRSLTTDWISVEKIEKDWQQVESLEQLAVKPVFVIHASDLYESLPPNKQN